MLAETSFIPVRVAKVNFEILNIRMILEDDNKISWETITPIRRSYCGFNMNMTLILVMLAFILLSNPKNFVVISDSR